MTYSELEAFLRAGGYRPVMRAEDLELAECGPTWCTCGSREIVYRGFGKRIATGLSYVALAVCQACGTWALVNPFSDGHYRACANLVSSN